MNTVGLALALGQNEPKYLFIVLIFMLIEQLVSGNQHFNLLLEGANE